MPRPVLISVLILLVAGTILASCFPGLTLFVAKRDVLFAHAVHSNMECTDCHADIEVSGLAKDRNLPAMDVCESYSD